MKKFTFLMCAILASLLKVNAQEPQFVSTEQQNRNVIIEEFTGRNCGYCPDGHVYAKKITDANPGRVWAVNVHCGSFSPSSYPNLNTAAGATILNALDGGYGFPSGTVNRTTKATDRNMWESYANQQLKQTAECNIGGQVLINEAARTATVNVEVYYTANSASSENYLTVMMLQDSILGSQSGGVELNPEQMIGNKYVHLHVLRDVVTPTWGDAIAPTTEGTLITRTYTYQIPESIGTPNGVDVDLNNLLFLAVVTEKQDGAATTPVLNVEELHSVKVADADNFPYFGSVKIASNVSCSTEKTAVFELVNGGKQELTSLKYEVKIAGNTTELTWEGSIPSYSSEIIEEELIIPVGKQKVEISIIEVNGSAFEYKTAISIVNAGWIDAYFPEAENEFKIDIVQDKYGNEITWELINSNEEVLASGGPYSTLVANGIKLHRTKVMVPNNECVKFIIRDAGKNGLNNGSGEGYYKITDSENNLIVKSDGKFAEEASHNISTKEGYVSVEEMTNETYQVYPNPVKDILTVEGENLEQVNVFNTMGQLLKTVKCNGNVVNVNVSDLQNGMYIVNVIDNNGEVSSKKVSVLK